MAKPKILVTAGAGKTGFATSMQLLEKDYPVRAFVRRPDRRSEALRKAGAEIFVGEMKDMRDLRKARPMSNARISARHSRLTFSTRARPLRRRLKRQSLKLSWR